MYDPVWFGLQGDPPNGAAGFLVSRLRTMCAGVHTSVLIPFAETTCVTDVPARHHKTDRVDHPWATP